MAELLPIPSPDDPEEAIATVVALRRLAEHLERSAVARAVEQRWTSARVAEALGVSRQAAHKRHAHLRRRSKREDPMPFPRPIRELQTIRCLLEGAERIAGEMGDGLPGAEHLLLAALDLPDGTARRSFERLAVDPGGLAAAITAQHDDALHAVGVDLDGAAHLDGPAHSGRGVFRATPSGQAVFQRAVQVSGTPKPRRLLGAHVVLAVAEMEHGSAARALRLLGVDRQQLATAAREELAPGAG